MGYIWGPEGGGLCLLEWKAVVVTEEDTPIRKVDRCKDCILEGVERLVKYHKLETLAKLMRNTDGL